MRMQQYTIDKPYKSVYLFLKQHGFSENYIKNLRKKMGYILVDGQNATMRTRLQQNQTLQINASPNSRTTLKNCQLPLDIVYEDDFYLVVNKPSGLATSPSRSHYGCNLSGAITNYMQSKCDDFVLRITNRLDKDTSGLVLVAKDSIAQKELGHVDKVYYALCEGKIEKSQTIDAPIATLTNPDGINQHKRVVAPNGKSATTFVAPIRFYPNQNFTLVKLTLLNGRTHQIRVHMSHIGHPLVGDSLYGHSDKRIAASALVCKQLLFFHPFENKQICIEVDFPQNFLSLLQ